MNCNEYFELIGDYCEQQLAPAEMLAVERHAAECPTCGVFHKTALEITCREVAELYDYVEGTLDPERRAMFERHFAICSACREYLATYKQTIRMGRAAFAEPATPAPDALPESLVRSILKKRPPA